jgi:hypothetical protein
MGSAISGRNKSLTTVFLLGKWRFKARKHVYFGNICLNLTNLIWSDPEGTDSMFQLNEKESANLRLHFGTSNQWGGRRYPPYAFTEQGVAMLSSVLRSKRAIQVNIEIMRS